MGDLYLGLTLVLVVSAVLARAGYTASRRLPYSIQLALVAVVIAGVGYLRSDANRLWLGGILPFSNLIIIGNLKLPAVAFVCGVAYRRMSGHPIRRCVLLGPLILLAGFDLVHPLFSSPPVLGNSWQNGVCRQTSGDSCGAAAAASLLHANGIETTEREMANLCLTQQGTSAAGIYRGLKLKTAGRPLRVEAFHCDIPKLRELAQTPLLLLVELRKGDDVDPRYQRDWGWTPGVGHVVVLFRFLPNNRIEVGDPDAGRETWNVDALRVLWHGNGMRVIGDGQ